MRYKLLVLAYLALLCCEFSDELDVEDLTVLDPPPDRDHDNEEDVSGARTDTTNAETTQPPVDGARDKRSDEFSATNPEMVVKIVQSPNLSSKDKSSSSEENVILVNSDFLKRVVEEINVIKYGMYDKTEEEAEEELPPLPESVLHPPEPTETELEAQQQYEAGVALLNRTRPDKSKAFGILIGAMEQGNSEAKALVGWAMLFGSPLKQNIAGAKVIFEELADIGHHEGHMGLGFLYAAGLAVNVSQPRALVHYTISSIGGNSWAQMALGYRHWSGITVTSNCEVALDLYRRVADKVSQGVSFGGGSSIQRIRLLDEMENGYSPGILDNDLIEYYQLLAEKGDVQAQVGLGQLHYQGGRGVDLDYKKAMHYFLKAAVANNPIAMAYLGKIYLDGSDDVKADNDTAFKYFKRASDLKNPVGMSGLGLMYLYGRGVAKDYSKAHNYFMKAADQGWVDGQLHLGNMYLSGLGVKKDYKQAIKYFTLASQSGHVLAMYNLGQMHAQGTGMMRSCPTAVEFFKNVAERGRWGEMLMQAHNDYDSGNYNEAYVQYALLAELGYEVAQSNVAFLLDRTEVQLYDAPDSFSRALLYWSRAAMQGYSAAQVKLGDYHYYGLGTAVDYETAASHYRTASDQQSNAQAMFNLGYMHEQGLGMERDVHLAKRCYDLAAETSPEARVPVALALVKLHMIFSVDSLQGSPLGILLDVNDTLGSNWDLCLITTLVSVVAAIIYFRRPQ